MKPISNWTIFSLLICCSCGVRHLPEPELLQYIADPANGLTSVVEKEGVRIEVNYRPSEVVMREELQMMNDGSDRDAAIMRYDSINYFVMRFSMNDREIETMYAGDQRKFGEVVSYLSYGVADDLALVVSGDTIKVLDVVYSRAFGSAGASQLMIAFNDNLKARYGPARLVLNDKVFGTGVSEFQFDCDKLKRTPRIKFP